MNRREAMMSALGAAALAGPLAAATRDASLAEARKLQDSTMLVDGLDGAALNEEYLGMLESAGVDVYVHSMGGFRSFTAVLAFIDKHSSRIASARNIREIEQAHKAGKIAHIAEWQASFPLIQEGPTQGGLESLLPAIDNLRTYKELGLAIVGLCYNIPDAFGGGSLSPNVGLSRQGKKLVEEIHRLNLVLDVGGHTADQTSYDALEISKGVPVICTHTNLRALTDNPRCMPDALIEKIAATGGVIGLTAVNDFHARSRRDFATPVTPQVGLEKHLDQYDYLKKLVGVDHIGLGPDYMWGRKDLDHVIDDLWPPEVQSRNPPYFMVKGAEKVTDLVNVIHGLMQRGWTDAELRKMLGENWLRVYGKVWGA